VLALAGSLVSSCSNRDAFSSFDSIVTEKLIRTNCKLEVPFAFTDERSSVLRKISANFLFGEQCSECNTYIAVRIATAGELLDQTEYELHRNQVKEADSDRPADMRMESFLFPNIGRRAMASVVLSPNGGGYTLVFTTSNGRFDVEIEQSSRLEKDVHGPEVDVDKIAITISDSYDKTSS